MSSPGQHSSDRQLREIFEQLGVNTRRFEDWMLWEAAEILVKETA